MSVSRLSNYDMGVQHAAGIELLMACRAAEGTLSKEEAIDQVVRVVGESRSFYVHDAWNRLEREKLLVRGIDGWIAV